MRHGTRLLGAGLILLGAAVATVATPGPLVLGASLLAALLAGTTGYLVRPLFGRPAMQTGENGA